MKNRTGTVTERKMDRLWLTWFVLLALQPLFLSTVIMMVDVDGKTTWREPLLITHYVLFTLVYAVWGIHQASGVDRALRPLMREVTRPMTAIERERAELDKEFPG